MSATDCERWRKAVDDLAAGRFDALSPEEMAEVGAHLDACESCAARLARRTAEPEPALRLNEQTPTEEQWAGVWENIASASAAPAARSIRKPAWRRWAPYATAVAAGVILLIGLWWLPGQLTPKAPELRLAAADEMKIDSLAVYDQGTPVVLTVGEDHDEISIIWVIEDEENRG
jgi:anti-sigma factor ChrR (cupin superfamily)